MSAQSHGGYYLPAPSYWPILGSSALLGLTLGATLFIKGVAGGGWVLLLGFALLVWMLFGWFGAGCTVWASSSRTPKAAR